MVINNDRLRRQRTLIRALQHCLDTWSREHNADVHLFAVNTHFPVVGSSLATKRVRATDGMDFHEAINTYATEG